MNQIVVAVFDSAAQVFGQPVFVASQGVALRSFIDEVNRNEAGNHMHAHPDDFTLYYIANYDDSNGKIDALGGGPEILVRAKDVKEGNNVSE